MENNQKKIGEGGNGGEVFLAFRNIVGDPESKISADGGDGSIGGKGGKITLISENNQFKGQISAKGGKSLLLPKNWNEKWWGILLVTILVTIAAGLVVAFVVHKFGWNK